MSKKMRGMTVAERQKSRQYAAVRNQALSILKKIKEDDYWEFVACEYESNPKVSGTQAHAFASVEFCRYHKELLAQLRREIKENGKLQP